MESTLHWIYVGIMLAGALIFFLWSRNPKGVPQYEYLIATFIPLWSAGAYMAMALGQGKVEVDEQITYYARYLDWVVTTPLLLVALAFTAMFHKEKNWTLIGTLVGADVVMIVSGLIADLSETPIRYLWYGVGVLALLVIFYTVWVSLQRWVREHQSEDIQRIYTRLAAYLTIFWIGYPLTWLIGPSGVGLVSQEIDTLLFIFLPVFSKVGFSLFDLSMLRGLDKSSQNLGQTSTRSVARG